MTLNIKNNISQCCTFQNNNKKKKEKKNTCSKYPLFFPTTSKIKKKMKRFTFYQFFLSRNVTEFLKLQQFCYIVWGHKYVFYKYLWIPDNLKEKGRVKERERVRQRAGRIKRDTDKIIQWSYFYLKMDRILDLQ